MATAGIRVCSLDVGQGMGTFVEVYDTGGNLIRTLLFDLGSTKASNAATTAFIAQQVRLRRPTAFIDAVFISHKDADHVSMIAALLDLLPGVGIGMVRYGGRRSWYTKSGGKNIITDMAARCATPDADVSGFPVGATNFDPDLGFFDHLWDMDDVEVNLMAVNTPHGDEKVGTPESKISTQPDGDQANSKSLVSFIRYNGSDFMISGDATFPSMVYINGVLQKTKMNQVKMILLPHHGSRKTTFGLPSTAAPISDEARAAVTTFARKIGAKTIIASANTKHSHPSLETTALFQNFSDKGTPWWSDPQLNNGTHFITMYQDLALGTGGPATGSYRSVLTPWNVYSTLYRGALIAVNFGYPPLTAWTPPTPLPVFPSGVNYLYTVGSNQQVTLRGISSGRTTTVEQALFGEDALPAAPEPPPPSALTQAQAAIQPALVPPDAPPLARVRAAW